MAIPTVVVINYCIFSLIATLANIGVQDVIVHLCSDSPGVLLSVLAGTAVGLVVKYGLDKRYIFRFRVRGMAHESKVFVLYTLMGVITTSIFWGLEYGFHLLFQEKDMRYLGAVLGLTIGYVIKFFLDKRYVFRTELS